MKKSITSKTLLLIITLILLVSGAYVYGIVYVSQSRTRVAKLTADVADAQSKADESDAVRETLDEFKDYQDAVESHFIRKDGIVSFVEEIEAVAKKAGVTLKIDQLEEGEGEPKLVEIGALKTSFTARGTWEKMMSFSLAADSLPYQVFVQGVNLSTDKTREGGAVVWVGSWVVSVPKFKDESALKK